MHLFRKVQNLKVGDCLFDENNQRLRVASVTMEKQSVVTVEIETHDATEIWTFRYDDMIAVVTAKVGLTRSIPLFGESLGRRLFGES